MREYPALPLPAHLERGPYHLCLEFGSVNSSIWGRCAFVLAPVPRVLVFLGVGAQSFIRSDRS